MDEFTRLLCKQYEIVQRISELQKRIDALMKEYNKISFQISKVEGKAKTYD